ncbi:MAG: TonB-dependent receptor [Nibricoccus sp.]
MPSCQRSRLPGLLLNIIALATSVASLARAQTTTVETAAAAPTPDTVELDKYVISATRTPQDPRVTPSAVTVIDIADLATSQISDLQVALAAQPGLVLVSSGAKGGQTSIFMRGAGTDQVLLFVDGVRMSSSEAVYSNFLGGADVIGIDRIEVLRGPQSTLYGSSAMGGVIAIETVRGCGTPVSTVSATAGSFDTLNFSATSQGGAKNFGYSASLARSRTANDRDFNSYKQTSYSARVEFVPFHDMLLGATVRGQIGRYEEPGTATSNKGEVQAPNHLVTAYVQWQPLGQFRSRLTHGWHQSEYTWTDKTYGPSSDYYYRNTRETLDWQNTWQAFTWLQLVGGLSAEWAHYTNAGNKLTDDQKSAYVSASIQPIAGLAIDVGGRNDKHELEGGATTGRVGVSYYLKPSGTKFRTTYGTGFKTPSMINRFGSPPWYGPSPTVKPEKSKGWDAGVDQELLGGQVTVSATYFHNEFRDLIVSSFDLNSFKYVARNAKTAYTEGGELAVSAKPIRFLKLRAAYTYLTAVDDSNSANLVRLVRRPRHTGDVEVQVLPTSDWVLGLGLHFVGDREDSVYDPSTFSSRQVDVENYAVARAFVTYAASKDCSLKLRVENALNETYAEAYGYQALSRGVFGSIDMKF